jgi:hypothetical protein
MHQIKIVTGAGSEWPDNIVSNVNEFLRQNPTYQVVSMSHTQHIEGSSIALVYNVPTKTKED